MSKYSVSFLEYAIFVLEADLLHILLVLVCVANLLETASKFVDLHTYEEVHVSLAVTKLTEILLDFDFNSI